MKVYKEISLNEFEAWGMACITLETILEHDKGDEFELIIDEDYPNGISDDDLNDLLAHDDDRILRELGIEVID